VSHLTDLELSEVVGGRSPGTAASGSDAHLAACETCRADVEALSRDLEALRVAHARRVPSEPFWMRERAAARRRLDTRPSLFRPSFALGALATAAVLAAFAAQPRPAAQPAGAPRPAETTERSHSPDDTLLLEAESLVAGSPAPLTSPL